MILCIYNLVYIFILYIFKTMNCCPGKHGLYIYAHCLVLVCPLPGLKQYYKLVQSHTLPHKVFEEKVQHLLELFSKIPFNQALVFSNLHTR